FALGGEVIDEDLMVLPGELIDFVVEDREALAEHRGAEVGQRAHLPVQRDHIDARGAGNAPGALIKLTVADLEALREAELAALDLVGDLESQRHGLAAGGLCIQRIRTVPEEEGADHDSGGQRGGAQKQSCATRQHGYSASLL